VAKGDLAVRQLPKPLIVPEIFLLFLIMLDLYWGTQGLDLYLDPKPSVSWSVLAFTRRVGVGISGPQTAVWHALDMFGNNL
jgi:hypothetical protein